MNYSFSIVIGLFMMEFMPIWCLSIDSRKRQNGTCAGSRWIDFGRIRFWQRENCVNQRRNENAGGRKAISSSSVFNMEDLPSIEDAPERNISYNPSVGYEPYWEDGSWVFGTTTTVPPSQGSEKPKPEDIPMCGEKCAQIYLDYGPICGRNRYYVSETFENYCALRNVDCSGAERWMVLYRGRCIKKTKLLYRIDLPQQANQHIADFIQKYNYTTFDHVGTPGPWPMNFSHIPK